MKNVRFALTQLMRSALRVSSGFLNLLGLQPALGRDFRTEEDAPGRNHVVIISHNLWQSRFGEDTTIIGRVVRIDGTPTEIVGVLPESAAAPGVIGPTEILRPIGMTSEGLSSYFALQIRIVGRYNSGAPLRPRKRISTSPPGGSRRTIRARTAGIASARSRFRARSSAAPA